MMTQQPESLLSLFLQQNQEETDAICSTADRTIICDAKAILCILDGEQNKDEHAKEFPGPSSAAANLFGAAKNRIVLPDSMFSLSDDAISMNDQHHPHHMLLLEPMPIGSNIDIIENVDLLDHLMEADIVGQRCDLERVEQLPHRNCEPPSRKKRRLVSNEGCPPTITAAACSGPTSKSSPRKVSAKERMDEEIRSHGYAGNSRKKSRRDFRDYQTEHWTVQFQAMVQFREKLGHCFVPHDCTMNHPGLSMWVKRQRYQYKLKMEGKHNTLTPERESLLENLGFVWDTHKAIWEERYATLSMYRDSYGDANVPTKFGDRKLAIWVKCQRRQYQLHLKGHRSSITPERIGKLEQIGFDWTPRGSSLRCS